MARIAGTLLWLVLCSSCWRDPDAVAARFAASTPESNDAASLPDVATPTCPEGGECNDRAPCLLAPKCVGGQCVGPERYWSRTVPVTSDRDQIDAIQPTGGGGLVAVGHADVSTAPLGLTSHVFAMHLGADGQAIGGQPPKPLWLKQDAVHDHVLAGIVPLGGTHYLGVGRHTDVDVAGPLGTPPRNWAWWMLFDADAGPLFDGKLEVDGSHAWHAIAQTASGVSLAVGVLDQSALLTRFTATGDKGWSRVLLPADVTRARLEAVTAVPKAGETWVAAGYTVDDAGNASGGWAVALAGPNTDVAWNQTYAPSEKASAAFYWIGAANSDEVLALGTLWVQEPGARAAEYAGNGMAKAWLVRINSLDGHRIAERTWQWPGNPGAFAVLAPDRLVVWQTAATGDPQGALRWLDAVGNPLSTSQFPRESIVQIAGHADGTVSLAGLTNAGNGDSYFARVSPWGATGCTDADACAAQSLASCDDGQACTADRCDAALGCTHTRLPDASPCANGTCHSGACTP